MPFRLIHLSDPHFGTADPRQAERLVELCRDLNPDLTLISGDFSMRARIHEMVAAKAWLARLPEPQLKIPGNHDVPLINHVFQRFFAPFKRYRDYICEDLEPTATLPIGKLISFNSSTPFGWHADWSRGFLDPLQAMRMSRDLMDVEGLRLVTFHHPLWRPDNSKRALIAPLPMIHSALAESKVDIVFSGHFHQSTVRTLDYTDGSGGNHLISQASTACSIRLKNEPAGFHVVDLEPKIANFTRYHWEDDDYQILDQSKFLKSGHRWQQTHNQC